MRANQVSLLCIPFGVIIGPCTVISNVVKVVADIAKLTFYRLCTFGYNPSDAYITFKAADLAWEKNISLKYKPRVKSEGTVEINIGFYNDEDEAELMSRAISKLEFSSWVKTYKQLSHTDKQQFAFERTQWDFFEHLTYIGIGIIRSIPLVGATALHFYSKKTVTIKSISS